jgi:hypothetical protein
MRTKEAAGTASKSRGSATKTPTSKTSPAKNTAARSATPAKTAAAGAGATGTRRDPISHRRKPITEGVAATQAKGARGTKKTA